MESFQTIILQSFIVLLLTSTLICKSIRTEKCQTYIAKKDVTCNCVNRNMTSIPTDCPEDTTVLNLDGNNFTTLRNHSFIKWTFLQSLSLKNCKIEVINKFGFSNLFLLEYLGVDINFIADNSLPVGVFKPLYQLKHLDIYMSNFNDYPDQQLSDLKSLRKLVINGFNGKIFGQGFSKLKNLSEVVLQPCNYKKLTNETFTHFKQLHILQLKCQIYAVEIGAFLPLRSLTSLDMSENLHIKLSDLIPSFAAFKDYNMTSLVLKSCYDISSHGYDVLTTNIASILGRICVSEIDLRRNNILTLKSGFFQAMQYRHCIKKLLLSDNCIDGDREVVLFEIPLLINLVYLDVSKQKHTFLSSQRNPNVNKSQFNRSGISTLELHIPKTLKFVNISNIYTRNSPFERNIKIKEGVNLRVMDFANIHFTSCQGIISGLTNLKYLNFSGSNCSTLSPKFFEYFPNLRHLTFRNAHLSFVLEKATHGTLFLGMQFLAYIDLSENNLKGLKSNLFYGQNSSLTRLVLDNNMFSKIPLRLSEYSSIHYLSLKNNKIEYLSDEEMNDIDKAGTKVKGYNFTIFLENNPMKCNCESTRFIDWLFTTKTKFDKNGNYSCLFIDGTMRSTSWAYSQLQRIKIRCISKTLIVISAVLVPCLIFFLLVISWLYKYKIPIQYWYYNIRRKYRLLKDFVGMHKYDAFIGYHHSDRQFVINKMVKFLEQEKGLKLCIHQRDFLAGLYISDNIMDAVKESKKVVLLVTNQYLKSKWGIFEFDMARMQMFQGNSDSLIIVMLEKIPPCKMPEQLLDIWEHITCVEAYDYVYDHGNPSDDKQFWKRLYDSLTT